jgi:hypothetical protein
MHSNHDRAVRQKVALENAQAHVNTAKCGLIRLLGYQHGSESPAKSEVQLAVLAEMADALINASDELKGLSEEGAAS